MRKSWNGIAVTIIGGLILWAITSLLEIQLVAAPRIVWGTFGSLSLPDSLEPPSLQSGVNQVLVENTGRAPARDVQLILAEAPHAIAFSEFVEHTVGQKQERTLIDIPVIGPDEKFTIVIYGLWSYEIIGLRVDGKSIEKSRVLEANFKGYSAIKVPTPLFMLLLPYCIYGVLVLSIELIKKLRDKSKV